MNEETLREAVYNLIGQASMCWSETPTGVFREDKATELGESFLLYLRLRGDDD